MNVYLRELRAHRKALFFWSIAMVMLIASSMAKFATYSSSGLSINDILDKFPKTVQVIFGVSGFDLSTAAGYFGVVFLYIALTASIHAALLGSEIISKEERDNTSEFLFVRPISRIQITRAKLLAGLTNLVIFNLVILLSSEYFVYYFTKGQVIHSYIAQLMVGLFILQLIFFSLGNAVAGIIKKPKATSSITTVILMSTFLLMFLINLNDKLDWLKYLSPFKYFDAKDILDNGIGKIYIFISMLIVSVGIYATFYFYQRRDLDI